MNKNLSKIKEYLEKNNVSKLKNIIKRYEDSKVAKIIDQLDNKNKVRFYLLIPSKRASEILLGLSPYSRKTILKSLKNNYVVSILKETESDDSVDILGEISEIKAKMIIEGLPQEKKEEIVPLIKYPEDSAGGLMQIELVSIPSDIKVREAMNIIKKKKLQGINYVYVVDKDNKLKGVTTLNNLITANSNRRVSTLINKNIVTLKPDLDKEEVAQIFRNEDINALPVVDSTGKLLGRVTVDDVLDVISEEATEDMYKFAGVNPDEHVFDPLFNSMRKRLPWLIVNLGTAFLAALTVSLFTETLQTVVILAAFMPIIAGLGGNSGTQTLTLIVRGLALNQLPRGSYFKILFKEVSLGLIHGMILGLIMGGVAIIWQKNPMIGLVIFIAMTISITLAHVIATSVPLLLKRMKIDPAVASSVFITASTDIIGFFSFLGIATLMLSYLV